MNRIQPYIKLTTMAPLVVNVPEALNASVTYEIRVIDRLYIILISEK